MRCDKSGPWWNGNLNGWTIPQNVELIFQSIKCFIALRLKRHLIFTWESHPRPSDDLKSHWKMHLSSGLSKKNRERKKLLIPSARSWRAYEQDLSGLAKCHPVRTHSDQSSGRDDTSNPSWHRSCLASHSYFIFTFTCINGWSHHSNPHRGKEYWNPFFCNVNLSCIGAELTGTILKWFPGHCYVDAKVFLIMFRTFLPHLLGHYEILGL